jgi:hypothetical protein
MAADGSAGRPLKIFINYRHEDTQPTAWLLYDKLKERFGPGNVFFDRDTLRPGERWLDEIKSHLAADGVLIALIGRQWMPAMTANLQAGGEDYVVKEIDLAFRSDRRITVIPVLADDARLPRPDELPLPLQDLPACQAESLRPTHLPEDIGHLIARLEEIRRAPAPSAKPDSPAPPPPRPRPAQPALVAPRPDEDHYRMVAKHAGNLVIFLGAEANGDDRETPWSAGSGLLPNDQDLARYLASHAELKEASPHLAEVAQYAYAIHGEQDLCNWITEALQGGPEASPAQDASVADQAQDGAAPSSVHEYLAHLPAQLAHLPAQLGKSFQMIVTPKYDAALEKALIAAGEDFDVALYMAPGTDQKGRFVHLPWGQNSQIIDKPNEYRDFPIAAADCKLQRTVIVRTNGAIADPSAGFPWEYNYVITEDHYIDYMGGRSAEEVVPGQILAKLSRSNYLFLGYAIADWRLRVFLQRIKKGERLGRAKYWAVEHQPDALTKDLWRELGVDLFQSSLTDYLHGLFTFLNPQSGEAKP